VIESPIIAPAVERQRQQRRLYLIVVVLVVAALFPRALGFFRETVEAWLGDQPYPFGPRNTLDFLAGCAVATLIAFALPDDLLRRAIRLRPHLGLIVGTAALALTIAGVTYIGFSIRSDYSGNNYEAEASVAANIGFAVGARVLFLVRRRPRAVS